MIYKNIFISSAAKQSPAINYRTIFGRFLRYACDDKHRKIVPTGLGLLYVRTENNSTWQIYFFLTPL